MVFKKIQGSKFGKFLFLLLIMGLLNFQIPTNNSSLPIIKTKNQIESELDITPLNISNVTQSNKIDSPSSSPVLENGYIRNGSEFKSAINLFENKNVSGVIKSPSTIYHRYFSRFPFQYININLQSNDSSIKLYFLDQFNKTIKSSVGSGRYKNIQLSSSESTSSKTNLRFIGWYYIKVTSVNANTAYNLSYSHIKGDGSSLWSPIIISEGTPAWSKIFTPRENSDYRSSLFFGFYVSKATPEIKITIDNFGYKMLHDPDFNFLSLFYYNIEWNAAKEGMYYIEVNGNNFKGKLTSINLQLTSDNSINNNTFEQAIEILRDSVTTEFSYVSSDWNTDRYLKIYLFQGENITLRIGNSENVFNFDADVFGPWVGPLSMGRYQPWITSDTDSTKVEVINLYNVPESGYYIIQVEGPTAKYNVNLEFHYDLDEGSSWQSANSIVFSETNFIDKRIIISETEYYYLLPLDSLKKYKITLNASINTSIDVLGTPRQKLLHSKITNLSTSLFLDFNDDLDFVYLNISNLKPYDEFTIVIEELDELINYVKIAGKVNFKDPLNADELELPYIRILLMENNGNIGNIIEETSTSLNGNFTFLIDKHKFDLLTISNLSVKIIFENPALQLRKGSQEEKTYEYDIDINDSQVNNSSLGIILIPNFLSKVSNIFYEITHAWLWTENLSSVLYGPEQVLVFYGSNTPGTFYQPFGSYGSSTFKYFISLSGRSSDDDALDDTVILHEYGHHIEQIYDISFSPAGFHTFDTVASTELGHGEGFPTFFGSIIKQNPVYTDTPWFNFNIDTCKHESSKFYGNLGSFGEISVACLYWDLVDIINNDDVNKDGISDDTTIDIDDLFDIFINYRDQNGRGVVNTNVLYQGLIFKYEDIIDNISRSYYEHGIGDVAYPFISLENNKQIESSDVDANFTWQLYDNNPKSYQIYLNENEIFNGNWNFTEEVIYLNLYQFNLSFGEKNYFKLSFTDTLGNQRNYTYWVMNFESFSNLGADFENAIELSYKEYFNHELEQTMFFSIENIFNGIFNISIIKESSINYSMTIYNNNYEIIDQIDLIDNFGLVYVKSIAYSKTFIKLTYLAGTGNVRIISNGYVIGSLLIKPTTTNENIIIDNSIYNFTSNRYFIFHSSPTKRNITFSAENMINSQVNVYYSNGTKINSYLIEDFKSVLNVFTPLQLQVSIQTIYNPFDTLIIEIIQAVKGGLFSIHNNKVTSIELEYIGQQILYKGLNKTLELHYQGLITGIMEVKLNNSEFLTEKLENQISIIEIDISNLNIGLYYFSVRIKDDYGYSAYLNFKIRISLKYQSSSTEMTTSKSQSTNQNSSDFNIPFYIFLVIPVSIGAVLFQLFRLKKKRK